MIKPKHPGHDAVEGNHSDGGYPPPEEYINLLIEHVGREGTLGGDRVARRP